MTETNDFVSKICCLLFFAGCQLLVRPQSKNKAFTVFEQPSKCRLSMGKDLGGLEGTAPKHLRWGTAHVFVTPIFLEAVLTDARESTNRVKKGVIKKLFLK